MTTLDESTADDGAVYRFYEWLADRDIDVADLDDAPRLRALIDRFDRGE